MPVEAKLALTVALLLLPTVWLIQRHDRISLQNKLSPVASEIAGHRVGVRCSGWWGRLLSPGDTDAGMVAVDADGRVADHTNLRTATCAELDALVDGGRRRQLACAQRSSSCGDDVQALAWAIGTVSHEAIHLRGILDERLTECLGLQYLAFTAQRLGATPEQARNLAVLHLQTSQPQMPDRYALPAGCENGGALDLRPDDPAWP